jgi:hypothetical protein
MSVSMARVPLAIISVTTLLSSSVMPGSTAGGVNTIDVFWPGGPTVSHRIVPWPTSRRTSNPSVSR